MKTRILLICAAAALIYSCSTEREEQLNDKPAEKAKLEKLEFKKLKTNKKDSTQTYKTESDSSGVFFPVASPSNGGLDPSLDPNPEPDPNEGGDPKNVPIPPRR